VLEKGNSRAPGRAGEVGVTEFSDVKIEVQLKTSIELPSSWLFGSAVFLTFGNSPRLDKFEYAITSNKCSCH
jgi:hypothetical protein